MRIQKSKATLRKELTEYMESFPTFCTHSHIDFNFAPKDLFDLFSRCYVAWGNVDQNDMELYIRKNRTKTYFIWLEKSLQTLYGIDQPITADSVGFFSQKLREAYADKNHKNRIFCEKCGYETILHDAFWNPGEKAPPPFRSVFRINSFFFGYNLTAGDHNRSNARRDYNLQAADIDEYESGMFSILERKKQDGCVALKSAIAYDRSLNFTETPKERANGAFCENPSPQQVEDFQNYIAFAICRYAAKLDIPLQIHTGLGNLNNTGAINLRELIDKNRDTKFVLFHGSYPWTQDILGLAHNYTNVYPDLCWLPIISTSAAIRFLSEALDVATSDKIAWGCDTFTAEESFGALLAVRYTLAEVLPSKIEEGFMSQETAEMVARGILYDNAKALYKL